MMQEHDNAKLSADEAKAAVLVEALPWINKMNGKTFVVKYGGAAMEDSDLCREVVKDLVLMYLIGVRIVLVHGGGKAISALMEQLDVPVQFKDGYRVTDEAAMNVVQMALVGNVNQMLVSQINAYGELAAGISGADGRTFECVAQDPELGRVGVIERVNTKLVSEILDDGYIPVIASVGWGPDGAYNVNADLAAASMAKALHADKLVYLSDVDGLYRDFSDTDSLISRMTLDEMNTLIASGGLESGMIPKMASAADALEQGVRRVHFLNGTAPHSLLLEFLTNSGIGTMFLKEE